MSRGRRIEERRFGGFSTRFRSLVIRYHIKARSVNRRFCMFGVQKRTLAACGGGVMGRAVRSSILAPARTSGDFVKNFSNWGLTG